MTPPRLRIEIYRGADGLIRWRMVARNGRVMADGAEGYASAAGVARALGVLSAYAEAAFEDACVDPEAHTLTP